jgi:hypothetical protein
MNRKYYIKFFQEISHQDKARNYNFTAGHLGIFSNPFITNQAIENIIKNNTSIFFLLCAFTRILFLIILSIIPLKNLAIFIRALLRKILNKKLKLSNDLLVLSIGSGKPKSDPYLSKILVLLKSQFDYLKVVGGKQVKGLGFNFFEQAFNFFDFAKGFIFIFYSQYVAILNLLIFLFSKKSLVKKLFFINYCLEEIISGALYNNYLLDIFGKRVSKYRCYKKLIFPMEGRNWEKKIVSNLNKSNCKIFGFIHCAITPRHLSLTSKMFYSSNEIPSIVITPSSMAYKLISKIFTSTRIVRGSFIRGLYTPDNFQIKKNIILFALTSNILECELIVKAILNSNLQNRFKVQIRLNPNTGTFKKLKNIIESNNLSLFSSSANYLPLVCLFRSSSTAIEYLSLGVNPIYINLKSGFSNNIFDLDNVYNFTQLDIDKFDSYLPNKISYNKDKCIEISNYYLKISNPLDFIDYIKD